MEIMLGITRGLRVLGATLIEDANRLEKLALEDRAKTIGSAARETSGASTEQST
jgi:hypothetical protein